MSNNVQSSYGASPAAAIAGQFADNGACDVRSVIAEAAITAALAVIRGATTKAEGKHPAAPDTADVDAIIATGGSTATIQTLSGSSLDGVVGTAEMFPPRNLTFTLSNHADWDLTVITVTGTDADGNVIQEDFRVPNAGNATLTGLRTFRTVTQVYIPAQSGTGGTFTMGFGSVLGPIGGQGVHGIALYDASGKPEAYPVDYAVPVLRRGRIYVNAEAAVDVGQPVYVRFVATGGEQLGGLRAAPDANDCALLNGARWASKTTGAGLAVVELNLP